MQSDDSDNEATFSSPTEAIAAGVQKALHIETLLILGRTRKRSEFHFRGCDIAQQLY